VDKRVDGPDVRAFVNWLFALSGYKTQAAFARAADVSKPELSDWMSGKRGIEGANLIRLMTAAGALAWPGWQPPPPPDDRADREALGRRQDHLQRLLDALGREIAA
jgi:transcriptional regulator with XRE-family HTH domain